MACVKINHLRDKKYIDVDSQDSKRNQVSKVPPKLPTRFLSEVKMVILLIK